MHDACRAISRGDLEVVLVTGAEALYTRAAARRDPAKPAVNWTSQPVEGTPRADAVRGRAARGDRPRDLPRHHPADPRLPALRERAARRQRVDAGRAQRRASASLWSRFSQVAASNPYAWIPPRLRPRGDHDALARQPHDLLPLSQALHGQHAGRPGRGVHRLLGGGGAGGRRARGPMGVPARGRRRPRPLVHLAPSRAPSLAGHPAGRPGRPRAGRRRRRRPRADRPLLVLPRCRADGGTGARASPSTTRTGR